MEATAEAPGAKPQVAASICEESYTQRIANLGRDVVHRCSFVKGHKGNHMCRACEWEWWDEGGE